jgi:hypothetical protein
LAIYSAIGNVELREAIRSTWGRWFRNEGIEVLFFLAAPDGVPKDITADMRNDDVVLIDVPEGYKYNSRKGVLCLEWIVANRGEHKFLIKADDDVVVLRPYEFLAQLIQMPKDMYVWGFMDYISPVPRSAGSPFFATLSEYPYSTFPPYPRGVFRVVSMDIVSALVGKFHKHELRMIYGDDPCFGVHLRQLRLDGDVPYIRLDDRDSYLRFAMSPVCAGEGWGLVTKDTWIVHHVNAEQITCMWKNQDVCECMQP